MVEFVYATRDWEPAMPVAFGFMAHAIHPPDLEGVATKAIERVVLEES